jgi:hypothetical protein
MADEVEVKVQKWICHKMDFSDIFIISSENQIIPKMRDTLREGGQQSVTQTFLYFNPPFLMLLELKSFVL